MLKKLKIYGIVSLGIISSIGSFKIIREEKNKDVKKLAIVIKEDEFFNNYNKSYNNNKLIYSNKNEEYEEIKTPILVGIELKENEKVYYYSKKMSNSN